MEESKEAQATPQVSNPPSTGQTLPPQPPAPPPSAALPPKSNKRPLESDAHLQNSSFFKLRAVIKDLRPHFLEVLRTPDFQNCKASHEIREQLKILIELYNQMRADVASLGKSKNMQDGKPSTGENTDGKPSTGENTDGKPSTGENTNGKTPPEQPQGDPFLGRPSEIKLSPPVVGFEKQQAEDGQATGTYIVGGSAFGWNFITYSGKESVYYGETKERFRSKGSTV